jgi:ParB family chromosome partitioning protein
MGYERLEGEFGYSQTDLAKVIGKSRSHVANTLRLLKLPEKSKRLLAEGALSAGHARALLTMADADQIAERIVAQGLSVRDVEKLSQDASEKPARKAPAERGGKDADTRALENSLGQVLGLFVNINSRGEAGEVRIRYESLEQLDDLCRKLLNR